MKKREGFWFTVISYIVENWLLRGYHLSRNPPKGRKKAESITSSHEEDEYPELRK